MKEGEGDRPGRRVCGRRFLSDRPMEPALMAADVEWGGLGESE